jgi:peptide/nickel transport system substrate-binding protein
MIGSPSFMNFIKKIMTAVGARFNKIADTLKSRRREQSDLMIAYNVVTKRKFPSVSQWRHLAKVTTPREKKIIRLGFFALALGLVLIIGSWAMRHAVLVPAAGGEYREGIVGRPHAINPILSSGNDVDEDIISLVYSGLFRYDESGRLVPDLASAVSVSPDGKNYTITVRGARFHDGVALTAADVAYTFQTIANPAWKSPIAANFSGVSVSAPDPNTAVFTLKDPNSYFLSLLTVGIIPKHIWEKTDPASVAGSDFNLKPVGSGPYRFLNFTRNSDGDILSYTLRAAGGSNSKIDKITFKFFDDYETAVEKLSSNAVDGLNFVPIRLYSAVAKLPNVNTHKINLAEDTAIFFNAKTQPIFSDPDVRHALALAVDRKRIVSEAMNGAAVLSNAPLNGKDYSINVSVYNYDPAGAEALLNKAGFVLADNASVRVKTEAVKTTAKKQPPPATTELDLTLTAINSEEGQKTANIIKKGWEAVGAKVNIVFISAADAQKTTIKDGDYQALVFGEILGEDGDPFPYWHSSQIASGFNLSKYSNRRVDELLEKARVTTDPAAKIALLVEFQKIITADSAAIFLYSPEYLYPQSSNVKNFAVTSIASPSDRFADITDWYIKKTVGLK